ncbi:MAG: putative membrane protein, partial [Candidatus Amesbacteria bacterium GW2011_GWA2_47_11]
MSLTLPVITSAALIDSVNPCAISVLLLTIGFLLSLEKSRREILSIAGFYILGIFVTYILIG